MNETGISITEQNLISICLRYPHLISEVPDSVFTTDIGARIFKGMVSLSDLSASLDIRTLMVEVNQTNKVISQEQLKALYDMDVQEGDFEYHIRRLQEVQAKENIKQHVLNDLLPVVSSKDVLDMDAILALRDTLDDNIALLMNTGNLIRTPYEMMDSHIDVLHKRNSGEYYHETGCSYLNYRLTEGFAPQNITTIFGDSGVGKSSFALYLVNKQLNKSIPSLYISLELGEVPITDKLICQRYRIPMQELYPNLSDGLDISDHVFDIVRRERDKLEKNNRFRFYAYPTLNLVELEGIIKRVKHSMGVDYLVVTIDLLTMIADFNRTMNKANDYEESMNRLHEIAKRNNVHIVGVVQARRPGQKIKIETPEDVERYRPTMEMIKNSGAIAERSRIVMSVYRARYYVEKLMPEAPELDIMENIMEIDVLKQNMGELGRLYYLFKPESSFLCKYDRPDIRTGNDE